ncbi:Electron transfer flavoprotein alpha-subunit [Gonapodya sp. JEL0774]|nr:Electron transfer flavoprotein alpha-subunit [Gonapodya sp. JEL0774]
MISKVPETGIAVFCGTAIGADGKSKKVNAVYEPYGKPFTYPLYYCDSKFHTAPLLDLLEPTTKFGFIVVDGHGALFATVAGSTRTILHKFSVDLPKKHGRGGQSAQRFGRIREEKRHNYIHKCAEVAAQVFLEGEKVGVEGLVVAGSAELKTELAQVYILCKMTSEPQYPV